MYSPAHTKITRKFIRLENSLIFRSHVITANSNSPSYLVSCQKTCVTIGAYRARGKSTSSSPGAWCWVNPKGGGGGESAHVPLLILFLLLLIFFSCCLLFPSYLILTLKPVDCPVNAIQTGGDKIPRYPLAVVLSPLSGHFSDFHWSREIKLDPLIVIVVSCAPGPRVSSTLGSSQSP